MIASAARPQAVHTCSAVATQGCGQRRQGGWDQRLTLHSSPAPERRRPFQCVARKQLTPKESRIGKVPIIIPQGVSVKIDGQHITVKVHLPLPLPRTPAAPNSSRVLSFGPGFIKRLLLEGRFQLHIMKHRTVTAGTPRRAGALRGQTAGDPASGGRQRAAGKAGREQEIQRAARPLEVCSLPPSMTGISPESRACTASRRVLSPRGKTAQLVACVLFVDNASC